jgi:hypothetical protein
MLVRLNALELTSRNFETSLQKLFGSGSVRISIRRRKRHSRTLQRKLAQFLDCSVGLATSENNILFLCAPLRQGLTTRAAIKVEFAAGGRMRITRGRRGDAEGSGRGAGSWTPSPANALTDC